jgi:hypothetical protein
MNSRGILLSNSERRILHGLMNLWKKEFLLTTTEESKKIMAMDGV